MGRKSKQKKMVEFEENQLEDKKLPELPEHIIFNILVKVPPDVLYHTCRFVSKEWNRLISNSEFICENTSYQKLGLLIQIPRRVSRVWWANRPSIWWNTSFLQIGNKFGVKLTDFRTPLMGLIMSCCNGLLLETESRKVRPKLCVNNVLTGSVITLPRCPSGCNHEFMDCGSVLGFNPITKEYKVVHIYSDTYGLEMFTIGSDHEWRRIPLPFDDLNDLDGRYFNLWWVKPVSINGQVIHWFIGSCNYIISMDIRDEKVSRTNIPGSIMNDRYDLVEMDGRLSLVHKASNFQIDVWLLKDFDKQIWSKEYSIIEMSINYKPLKAFSRPTKKRPTKKGKDEGTSAPLNREERKDKLLDFLDLEAHGTLRNGEVIMLMHRQNSADPQIYTYTNILYLYDSKHQEMSQLTFDMKEEWSVNPHRISLVSLRNDQMELSAAMSNIRL